MATHAVRAARFFYVTALKPKVMSIEQERQHVIKFDFSTASITFKKTGGSDQRRKVWDAICVTCFAHSDGGDDVWLRVGFEGTTEDMILKFPSLAERECFVSLVKGLRICGTKAFALFCQLDTGHIGMLDSAALRESLVDKPLQLLFTPTTPAKLDVEHFIYLMVSAMKLLPSELVVEEEVDLSKVALDEAVVYQNERHYPMVGWSSKLLPGDWHPWSSLDGSVRVRKDVDFSDFDWGEPLSQWLIDRRPHHVFPKSDDKGWCYCSDFAMTLQWSSKSNLFNTVRRRRWIRRGRRAKASIPTAGNMSSHRFQQQQWQRILLETFPDSTAAMRLSLLDGEEMQWRIKASLLTGTRRGAQRYLHGTFYFTDYRVLFKVHGSEEARVNIPVGLLEKIELEGERMDTVVIYTKDCRTMRLSFSCEWEELDKQIQMLESFAFPGDPMRTFAVKHRQSASKVNT
jgi:hypothetical protein